jgi:septal ring factor EnvC (AmiA/AmiB activator)
VLLTATTLTEAAELATYTRRLAQIDRDRVARYKATLKKLTVNQRELKSTSSVLAKEQADADRRAKQLRKSTLAKRNLLASVQKERRSYEQAQQEMEAAARELGALLTRLDEEKRANTLYTVETENEVKARDASFSLMKGRLPWPIRGRLLKKPKRDALLHKGVYIEVSQGDAIAAVAGGTVVFADYFRGYGNLCIIDHGTSYHTLYAHAQDLSVRIGERVEAGQIIGRAGFSGAASSPRLYFELRHRGRPINPLPWMVARAQ